MGDVYKLVTPLTENDIRKLNVGDIVYLYGVVYTARDAAHKRIVEYINRGEKLPFNLSNGVIYHCGPVVVKEDNSWRVVAAGPTTSMRMELYEHEIIKRLGVRMIIGKGGMGSKTVDACKKHGAVYTIFTGGAAVLAAQAIKRVIDVYWLDLGIPEAVWVFEVENFGPLTIAIDAHGRNAIDDVLRSAAEKRKSFVQLSTQHFYNIEHRELI
ncbi:FumA C-terminus/TtdB family hydratase beta subunit [Ignisphaera sp. 4213-co]|uniref:FumA C-terminus/TtdB family hydratase beta subunit n=1 Tax=Ignisphaera cupida TaxID=3050454 RepID=A0ABD4Z5Z7_9CREN|nr:FumA C-terminus/TtdB family hydratase beta subunit [Ignisphaera sp. 4213-co]MDK6028174.1 FumA C-terminus/TtdB family hydratase beta subunit [Ignisphaera sp. 4213-co]